MTRTETRAHSIGRLATVIGTVVLTALLLVVFSPLQTTAQPTTSEGSYRASAVPDTEWTGTLTRRSCYDWHEIVGSPGQFSYENCPGLGQTITPGDSTYLPLEFQTSGCASSVSGSGTVQMTEPVTGTLNMLCASSGGHVSQQTVEATRVVDGYTCHRWTIDSGLQYTESATQAGVTIQVQCGAPIGQNGIGQTIYERTYRYEGYASPAPTSNYDGTYRGTYSGSWSRTSGPTSPPLGETSWDFTGAVEYTVSGGSYSMTKPVPISGSFNNAGAFVYGPNPTRIQFRTVSDCAVSYLAGQTSMTGGVPTAMGSFDITCYSGGQPIYRAEGTWNACRVTDAGCSTPTPTPAPTSTPTQPPGPDPDPADPPAISGVSDRPDPFSPNGDGRKDKVTIFFTLEEDASVVIRILNNCCSIVTLFTSGGQMEAGSYYVRWRGLNKNGRLVKAGTYRYLINAENDAGQDVADGYVSLRR